MVSDNTSLIPSDAMLCIKGCGHYGSLMGLCSKCFLQEQLTSTRVMRSLPVATKLEAEDVLVKPDNRCKECKKRVKIGLRFQCRCGYLFCTSHKYPEKHGCLFDYKMLGKQEIAKANPIVKADKI